jgi:hypothetical protein
MLAFLINAVLAQTPAWRSLEVVDPAGDLAHTGSYTTRDRTSWHKPPFVYNEKAATGRKCAKVVVLIYDPVLENKGGKRLTEFLRSTDPEEASRSLADVVREASWGYLNYEIVDVIRVDGYPKKVDGFRYDDATYMEVRDSKKWQPSPASYGAFFLENGLLDRFKREGITELWVWGADGFHMDEFAMFIPNRYARFGPTENPWLYRPYDIPAELGRTTWVMGFNIEVGIDNAIHSYAHRIESMAALAVSEGVWDTKTQRDPWNIFSSLELDHPGQPSQVGNCHCPPNARDGYDYNNPRRVDTWAWHWWRYPDVRGQALPISSNAWGNNQFGYMKWLLEHVPKSRGSTRYGYNNWWLYIANTDEELDEWTPPDSASFKIPDEISPSR